MLLAFFRRYLDGETIRQAAAGAGVHRSPSACCAMLRNRRYLGDGYYPALVPEALFDQVQQRLQSRKSHTPRRSAPANPVGTSFRFVPAEPSGEGDRAQWLYRQIRTESQEVEHGSQSD